LICHLTNSQSAPAVIIKRGAAKPRARESVNALIPLSLVFCRCGGVDIRTLVFVDVGVAIRVVGVALCGIPTGVAVVRFAVVMGLIGRTVVGSGLTGTCCCVDAGVILGVGVRVGVGVGVRVGVGVGVGVRIGVGVNIRVVASEESFAFPECGFFA